MEFAWVSASVRSPLPVTSPANAALAFAPVRTAAQSSPANNDFLLIDFLPPFAATAVDAEQDFRDASLRSQSTRRRLGNVKSSKVRQVDLETPFSRRGPRAQNHF
jgi:hypothetical protein